MSAITFAEAKSRHITPAKSIHDFQKSDGILVKSGETVKHKLVKDIQPPNSLVVADPDGGGVETITLNPNSPAKDSDGEFKYWIDEGDHHMTTRDVLGEMDDIDAAFDDDFPAAPEDVAAELDDMDGDYDESFAADLKDFLGEEDGTKTSQVPDGTVGGGVSNDHDSEDGEGTEDPPAPHDTTGIQNAGDVNTMAGDRQSNVGGSAPSDEVSTHGDVGGSPTIDQTLPQKGEHEPGSPDRAASGVSEQVREEVNTALSLVKRGANPKVLAPRLLRGA